MPSFVKKFLFGLLAFALPAFGMVDLEKQKQSFVLETNKIEIPGHPHAFNPSIIRWRGSLLLSFRELFFSEAFSFPIQSSGLSHMGLVFLNDDFSLDGEAQMINIPSGIFPYAVQGRSEDARLINIDERLYIVYSDNPNEILTEDGFRMFVGELDYNDDGFFLRSLEALMHFPGESPSRREKNWVPFNYRRNLLLAYSIQPHLILRPFLDGSEECNMCAFSSQEISWKWGELRGGTPALRIGNEYLSFFHSSIEIATVHSNGQVVPHYFIGAYTFQKDPPFALTQMSPEPIIGENFYHGQTYPYYWKPVQVVFPCGFVFDDRHIWMVYGRQDHEIWIAKIDRAGLFSSLVPVKTDF